MAVLAIAGITAAGCGHKENSFKYTIDQFADVKVMRYRVPGWEDLTLQQKEYAYHLAEAAKYGRDILWDQNCKYNLQLRSAVEKIIKSYDGNKEDADYLKFIDYSKRLFFSNGIHHHYSEDKFFPECRREFFKALLDSVGADSDALIPYIYDKDVYPQRRSTSKEGDIVAMSGVNFYEGVTREEVEAYYASVADPNDPQPISYGLNTKVVKEDGVVVEKTWKVGGIYSDAIVKICEELEKAALVAENDIQKAAIAHLIKYYNTGDLKEWDAYNIEWVKDTLGIVDFVNGFVEDYNDPLGRKGAWEGHVNIKDVKASERTVTLAANAQWFEDNAPIDQRFKKTTVKGVSAKVINAVCLAGDAYPSTPIGINLPNADWIRKDYGSKSVSIANITQAYELSANESPKSTLNEFAFSKEEKERNAKYGSYASEIHTDLHECLGHGSGQLLPGVSATAMGEYSSTLEEARADLFGLYFSADPKLVELGIMPDNEAYKAEYDSYIRNGLLVQFTRVELGRPNTEAHMQNRQLISEWCYRQGGSIEKKTKKGKTYFVITDYELLRQQFALLLAEIQRIKSEGDYEAGKALVDTYAVNIDPEIHKEVKARYQKLGLKPYGGFLNPEIVPIVDNDKVTDYILIYPEDLLGQMVYYSNRYGMLK